jgi:hypothetical protein
MRMLDRLPRMSPVFCHPCQVVAGGDARRGERQQLAESMNTDTMGVYGNY